MIKDNKIKKTTQRFFGWFIVLHTLLWTLGPWLTRSSLPHDTLESITWGMQWQWGYNKHPFLAAWLTYGMTQWFNATEWPVYLLAQLAVSVTFVASWQLARQLLPPVHAIIAALALDGVLYYNINSFNITPDTLQSPLWAILTLCFYQATKTQLIRYWLATGVMVALCLSTKYQVLMLLVPMALFCLVNPHARLSVVNKGLYAGLGVMLLVIFPHLKWLWQHDFMTIRYALGAPYDHTDKSAHVLCLLSYLANCLAYIAGAILLFWPFYHANMGKLTIMTGFSKEAKVNAFNGQFLLFTGIGPCFLTACFCFVNGDRIPIRWSTPYFFLIGIIMMTWLKPKISALQLKQCLITLIIFSGLLWGLRMSSLMFHWRTNSDAYLPNKAIAAKLTQLWHQHESTPLHYVGGAHYLIGAVVPYMPDMPMAYFSWDNKENPWLNEKDLIKRGGIFVWDKGANYFWDAFSPKLDTLPDQIKQRFPTLIMLGTYTFYRSIPGLKPVRIGVALLPNITEVTG